MNRQQLIQMLVIDSIEHLQQCRHSLWLQSVLEDGFSGFSNMPDEQLLRECRWRGISPRADIAIAGGERAEPETEDDEAELVNLVHSYRKVAGSTSFD